jgi:deoxyguanosine kinase
MKYNYIAIEGNIGSGKTSLAKMIAKDFDAKLILERFEDNSFLPKFYKDPEKFAFPLEMSFLADRYQQLINDVMNHDLFMSFTIADYFIDKSLIFARQTLKKDEFKLYTRLFKIIIAQLPKPDLILFLYTNTQQVKLNIQKRGREYEQDISDIYLEKIQNSYFDYFKASSKSTIIILDSHNLDFVSNKYDYNKIISLFEKEFSTGLHRIAFEK